MVDYATAPGFMDYVLGYEAQGMSKEQAIDKAHERFFGGVKEMGREASEEFDRENRAAILRRARTA